MIIRFVRRALFFLAFALPLSVSAADIDLSTLAKAPASQLDLVLMRAEFDLSRTLDSGRFVGGADVVNNFEFSSINLVHDPADDSLTLEVTLLPIRYYNCYADRPISEIVAMLDPEFSRYSAEDLGELVKDITEDGGGIRHWLTDHDVTYAALPEDMKIAVANMITGEGPTGPRLEDRIRTLTQAIGAKYYTIVGNMPFPERRIAWQREMFTSTRIHLRVMCLLSSSADYVLDVTSDPFNVYGELEFVRNISIIETSPPLRTLAR